MAATVFPAAAAEQARDVHPTWCACNPCTSRVLAVLGRPLVPPGAATDRAGKARNSSPAGYASTERRTHHGLPAGVEQGGAGAGAPASPTRGGAR